MFSLLGNEQLGLLLKDFQVASTDSLTTVTSRNGSVSVTIDISTYPPHISGTTMRSECAEGTNCFDHLAASPSECPACPSMVDCPGARFIAYMPEIYVASTFEERVREGNVLLKQALHEAGLMPTLPQHLSVGNPGRKVKGGTLAEEPETRGGELATLGGRWCEAVMRRCDGAIVILNRMKQDSSWETGFLHALRTPMVAVYYDDKECNPLDGFALNWMVRLTAFEAIVPFPSTQAVAAFTQLRQKIHLRKQAQK
jgi:nucleoside 2-deoxyribosyltransferase